MTCPTEPSMQSPGMDSGSYWSLNSSLFNRFLACYSLILYADRKYTVNPNAKIDNELCIHREVESVRAMQLVVARVAPDIRVESKLRAEALKDQVSPLTWNIGATASYRPGAWPPR